jgi:hypothetical protein
MKHPPQIPLEHPSLVHDESKADENEDENGRKKRKRDFDDGNDFHSCVNARFIIYADSDDLEQKNLVGVDEDKAGDAVVGDEDNDKEDERKNCSADENILVDAKYADAVEDDRDANIDYDEGDDNEQEDAEGGGEYYEDIHTLDEDVEGNDDEEGPDGEDRVRGKIFKGILSSL